MPYGVYDPEFKLNHALSIVRRYVDRNAQLLPDRSGIEYKTNFFRRREWKPAMWGDGTPIRTKKGKPILSPQYVRDTCILSRMDAFKLVNDLNEG